MNGILIGFVAGAAGFHLLSATPGLWWTALCLPALLLWRTPRLRPWVAVWLGGCWSLVQVNDQMAHWLPRHLEGQDLILQGIVEDLPRVDARLQRFQLKVDSLQDPQGNPVPVSRLQLSWFGRSDLLQAGETWRLKVRLRQPRGLHNPAGYDRERGLMSKRLGALGYVREWTHNRRIEPPSTRGAVDRLRQAIARGLEEFTANSRAAALFRALAIGDRRGLSDRDWRIFTRTGTNHLMAISGLHIGIVAGWALWLGSRLWRRSEWLCQRYAALRAGAWLALLLAIGYAALAGFSLPTQRALLMLGVVLGGVILGFRISLGKSLLWALFLVVLVDPLAPLEAGFWLSFLAVGSIWWIAAGRLESAAGWRQALVIQGAVTLGLVPMLFLLFGQASLIAPLVNLIMVPWFSLVLVPLLLLGLPLLIWPDAATLWFAGLGHLADLSLGLLEGCAALSWAAVSMPQAGLWVWLLALMGVLLGLLPRGVPGRWMGLWMCLPVLVVQPERPVPGGFWLTLLDVGQGLACVVETRNHVLLYDTGPGAANGYSAAAAVIEPYLLSRGRSRIDRLILSNGDQDHAGGATFLKSALAVLSTLSGESARVGDAEACESGLQWDWDGVSFRILHPAPGDRFNDSNNRSCVLQVESGGHRVLLPGDVEKDAEQRLVARYPDSLQSQILIASHHGSAGASSPAWVEAVQPDWVLFSTGYRNSYGFPRASVVDRWRAQGAATLNTADCGSIRFRVEPGTALEPPRRHCVEEKHYWQNCTVSENR